MMKRNVSGILLLDKGIRQSSNETLQEVKQIFAAKKAGHTGTLDVRASGLLPICFGEATKVSKYLLQESKSYTSQFTFGKTTRSGDLEGEVLSEKTTSFLTEAMVVAATERFVGSIAQVPPMYSALKRNGVPLYKYARRGIDVHREAREVEIYRFELKEFRGNTAVFYIECSKGTYIRKLAEDIGEELGCGACVSSLRREQLGSYDVSRAYTVDALRRVGDLKGLRGLDETLLKTDSALTRLPSMFISNTDSARLKKGQKVCIGDFVEAGLLRLYDEDGLFFGIGERLINGEVTTRRLIRDGREASKFE